MAEPYRHPHFNAALNTAFELATNATRGMMVFIVAPSNSGKSVLAGELPALLCPPIESWQPGKAHCISVSARNSDRSYYSHKDLVERMLVATGDALARHSNDPWGYVGNGSGDTSLLWSGIRRAHSEHQMALRLERTAPIREIKFVIVDNADDMTIAQQTRIATDHLISLRGLLYEMNAVGILLGTYDLLKLWDVTAQLNERSAPVHLRRYDSSDKTQVQSFAKMVMHIRESFPLVPESLVKTEIRFIHGNSFGIFGGVERIFVRATAAATADGSSEVELRHLRSSGFTPAQLTRLYREVTAGEKQMLPANDREIAHLRKFFELPKKMEKQAPKGESTSLSARAPGRRNPIRDPVGMLQQPGSDVDVGSSDA